ncbi:autophagy-related protein 9A-like [Mytilus edulis]|uniref:autophagy-related protein 9A-like n=1 Tax=Mytilus edulis TaxID=6550 RepID=UPI0039EFEF74
MAEYETPYQALATFEDDETDEAPSHDRDFMIHVVPESTRWNHIENLDDFFARVYNYHQRGGFGCMVIEDILQLIQFLFVVLFSIFLIDCVDYDVLFANIKYNGTHKVTIPEAVIPLDQCVQRFSFGIIVCMLVAFAFWVFRTLKVIYNVFKYTEIRSFYNNALKITAVELANLTWHEIQRRLLEVQKEQQMCIHKQELSELDIYHRILRFKNYMIAMVNKSVIPVKFKMPFVGQYAFLSTGLKYNLDIILFWGPWSPFENNWKLKEEYKHKHRREYLSQFLSQRILWIGIANFILSPVIFLWQILYSFFRYAELIKRQPNVLGTRRWSNYARIYVRHLNELDHEFTARLNRGYEAANMYLDTFTSPLLIILAKYVAFFAGSIGAVLVVLTVIDEDVLAVEHIFTVLTISGLIVTGCRVLIPDEHLIYCPEILMRTILAHIHYMPDSWKGNAHRQNVRDEFSLLFQYKVAYLLEELFSPLITPFILCFSLRHQSLQIVDFFRNFTVDVAGVGDVCSFAQMDIKKHGNPQWVPNTEDEPSKENQSEGGKTELSLMHFHMTNPEWKLTGNRSMFVQNVKTQVQKELVSPSIMQGDGGLMTSRLPGMSLGMLPSVNTTGLGLGYNSLASSITMQSAMFPGPISTLASGVQPRLRGGLSHIEGPLGGSGSGIFSSMQSSSGSISNTAPSSLSLRGNYDEGTIEMLSHDMSYSAIYLHDMQFRKAKGNNQYETLEDVRARSMWQRQDSNQPTVSTMPNIQEKSSEEESTEEVNTDKLFTSNQE